MKPKKQRVAIAKACGWRFWPDDISNHWTHPKDTGHGLMFSLSEPPHYLYSLDSMSQAEKTLLAMSDDTFEHYIQELSRVVDLEGGYYITATAPQRAQAFLKTLGLWVEDEE